MSSTFETVVIAVAVIGIVLSFTRLFSPLRAADQLGHIGSWFDHEDDHDLAGRSDPSENDPPIPRRPLKGRM